MNAKRIWLTWIMAVTLAGILTGQGKYLTNEGTAVFYSHTAIEDITAENNAVASVIDSENGEVAAIAKMTAFQFEKKLMQEHFNENYVESEKFPKATFNGFIMNNSDVDYTKKGTYQIRVEGDMTIHGVKRKITSGGTIEVTGSGIIASTKFMLNPGDYDIKIPNLVRKNIAENMEIRIDLSLKPM